MIDPRGTYQDGYKYAREGGKPSEMRNEKGLMIGYRQGTWLDGFRQAQIDMREEARQKGLNPMPTTRFKMTTKWR